MSLLKLSQKSLINFDPIDMSKDILMAFNNFGLIQNAYLFGSGAQGKMTPDSDLDILITFRNTQELALAREEFIHSKQNIAIDWIFKTQIDFENEKSFGGVSYEAFHFGIQIK